MFDKSLLFARRVSGEELKSTAPNAKLLLTANACRVVTRNRPLDATAVDPYERGIELSEPDSEYSVCLMVLKCAALMAQSDRPALDQAAAALYALKPMMRLCGAVADRPVQSATGTLTPRLLRRTVGT